MLSACGSNKVIVFIEVTLKFTVNKIRFLFVFLFPEFLNDNRV